MKRIHFILMLLLTLCVSVVQAQVSVESTSGLTTEVTGSVNITLDGNWTNNGTLTAGNSTILLNGSGVQTITNASGAFYNLTINKASADAQAAGNFTVDGTFTLTSGDVDLNGNVITLGTSALLAETLGNTVKGATGYITTTRDLGVPSNDNVGGLGFEITSDNNLGSTVIQRGHAAQSGNGNQSILRYFEVTPTINTGLNATVIFRYDDSELNGQTEANLALYKSEDGGSTWSAQGGTTDGSGNTVTLSGIESLSRWTAAEQSLAGAALVADAGADQTICAGQSVQIGDSPTATGGTPSYTYAWSPTTGLDDATLANPTANPATTTEYIVTVTDANSTVETDTVLVTVNPTLVADAGADQTLASGGSVQIGGSPTASGGLAPYTYAWSPTTDLDDAAIANPTASPSSTTTYTVTVTDANGCTATDEVIVAVELVQPFVFLANKITLESTKQVPSYGDMHSNGTLTVNKGDPSTYNSNLTAVGNITIGKYNTINGDVTSQTSISNSGNINGTKTIGPVDSEPLPSLSYSAGGPNKTLSNGGSLSLAPGSYGIVTLNENSTLKLTSGEYFMDELRYSSDIQNGVIEIDLTSGAPVTINVVSNLQFGHEAAIVLLPNGEADSKLVTFNTLQTTNADWGREAYLVGSFNAPNAVVTLVKNTQLRGSICAKEIYVSTDCLFLHHDSPGSLPGPGNLPKSSGEEVTSEQSPVSSYELSQNYPNPFNPSTTISFALLERGEVSLSIYNMSGQLVKKLVAGEMNAGRHSVVWDATNARGERVASGVYLYVIKAGTFTANRKLVLMK